MRILRLCCYSSCYLLAAISLSACLGDVSKLKVGSKAPIVHTKTLADVNGNMSRITTYRYPDKRMYQYSIDAALKTGKPIVLAFATPAHCTQCDKQLQILKAALNKFEDNVIFMHMDQYENPEAYKAYTVLGDPWTFIIDQNQTVRYKQAGRLLYGEINALISDVLANPGVAIPTPAQTSVQPSVQTASAG